MISYAFFGSDEFSVLVLEELVRAGYPPSLIITMPDRPVGRHGELTPPQLKEWAQERGVLFIQPASFQKSDFQKEVRLPTFDIFIVASYGKIIPESIFSVPSHGTINVHPSLLPAYRGATPIEGAILNGERSSGVSIMRIDKGMDHGPIIAQKEVPLSGCEWYPELAEKLAREGGILLANVLPKIIDGSAHEIPQDDAQASYTKRIQKEDGFIDLQDDPETNFRKIRAYEPWPRTFFKTTHNGKELRVIIITAHLDHEVLIIDRVTPEGGHEMSYQDFVRGHER